MKKKKFLKIIQIMLEQEKENMTFLKKMIMIIIWRMKEMKNKRN